VRNEGAARRRLRLVADGYVIPPPIDCRERPSRGESDRRHPEHVLSRGLVPAHERAADWTAARLRHAAQAYPVPQGWEVEILPQELDLEAGETHDAVVSITPPDGFAGRQAINVGALHGTDLVGGVTLIVEAEPGG
jgi:hypothetical protein